MRLARTAISELTRIARVEDDGAAGEAQPDASAVEVSDVPREPDRIDACFQISGVSIVDTTIPARGQIINLYDAIDNLSL
jgi:hypothetical protein